MLEQNRVQMRGGEVLFIGRRARLTRHDAAQAVQLPRGDPILPRQHLSESSSIFACISFFDPIFEGSFGGLPELKMGHAAYRRKALDVLFPTV